MIRCHNDDIVTGCLYLTRKFVDTRTFDPVIIGDKYAHGCSWTDLELGFSSIVFAGNLSQINVFEVVAD
jgi:hypothetical protein